MVILWNFIPRLKSWNHFVELDKQHHRKLHPNSFHLNSLTLGFHQRIQKLELLRRAGHTPKQLSLE